MLAYFYKDLSIIQKKNHFNIFNQTCFICRVKDQVNIIFLLPVIKTAYDLLQRVFLCLIETQYYKLRAAYFYFYIFFMLNEHKKRWDIYLFIYCSEKDFHRI